MKTATMLLAVVAACGFAIVRAGWGTAAAPAAGEVKFQEFTFSKPYIHKNLEVFLIHGPNRIKETGFLFLDEALTQKKLIVHETGNVNELAIENTSEVAVFIQGGEIIRGGKQDRTCPNDMIIPPHSGRLPLSAFCVEQGRWSARQGDSAAKFGHSANALSTRELKVAARVANGQDKVWTEVSNAQKGLTMNGGSSVNAAASPTSLELSLDHEVTRKATEEYVKYLSEITTGQKDVVGYVTIINGKIESVDLYGSNVLFEKLWPKLLKSAAVEAVVKLQKDAKFDAVSAADVKTFMEQPRQGEDKKQAVGKTVVETRRETNGSYVIRSDNAAAPAETLHEQYLKK